MPPLPQGVDLDKGMYETLHSDAHREETAWRKNTA
jgi:hypothetical protein